MKINDIKNPTVRAQCRRTILPTEKGVDVAALVRVRARAVVRPTTDENGLNKTESAWHDILVAMGKYARIRVHAVTLKLADDTRYTPDFQTTDPAGEVIFWEVKGFFRDDAKVKIKVAARDFTEFKFMLVRKECPGWITQEVKP